MRQLTKCILILIITCIPTYKAQTQYYYTNGSTILDSNTCPKSLCAQCGTGFYKSGCGTDATKTSAGTCVPCPGLPNNATWVPWGPYPSGISNDSSICNGQWECDSKYTKTSNTCVLGACVVNVSNSFLTPSSLWPNCTTQCRAGYTGDQTLNPKTCTICRPGTYAALGDQVCSSCPLGKYLNASGATSLSDCVPAIAGQYVNEVGSAIYKMCIAGTYSPVNGSTTPANCLLCPLGKYCTQGSAYPTNCPPGTFSAEYGAADASKCLACPMGKYCTEASTSPTDCPQGTFNNVTGASSALQCRPCSLNTYMDLTGASACFSCALCSVAGQYKTGCGGSSAGSCTACSNKPP